MSASFAGFASAFQSTQHLQATSLVGRPVHVASDTTALDATGGISIIADLEKSTSQASLSVYDQAGTLVDSYDLGPQASGRAEFLWTGFDANEQRFPAGMYTFRVAAAKAVPTFLSANVNSVTIEPGGSLTLNLAGIGPKSLDEVIQIN
jgi:flagellar basal-body rod modification protein FlgD